MAISDKHCPADFSGIANDTRANPCPDSYREVILRVEITRLFIPGGSITDSFCVAGEICCPPQPGVASPNDAYDCFGFTQEGDYSDDTDPDCIFNPDVPPLWWLKVYRDRVCQLALHGLATANFCTCANYFVANYSSIASFPTGLCQNEWFVILETWRQFGAYLTAQHCGGDSVTLDASNFPPDTINLTKTKIRFPAGTYIISRRCVDMTLDEVCELCQGY